MARDFVWAWDDGRPHDPDYLYQTFQKLIKKYNETIAKDNVLSDKQKRKNITRYTLSRFTSQPRYFSLLAGVPVKVISERLGHSTTRVTQDFYSHVLPQMQEKAAYEVDRLLIKK